MRAEAKREGDQEGVDWGAEAPERRRCWRRGTAGWGRPAGLDKQEGPRWREHKSGNGKPDSKRCAAWATNVSRRSREGPGPEGGVGEGREEEAVRSSFKGCLKGVESYLPTPCDSSNAVGVCKAGCRQNQGTAGTGAAGAATAGEVRYALRRAVSTGVCWR